MKLAEIARIVGGSVSGNAAQEIHRLAKIEEAEEGDISFVANPKYIKYLESTMASAVLVADVDFPGLRNRSSPLTLVKVADPYQAFLQLIDVFYPSPQPPPTGTHPTAVVAATAHIGPGCAIGAHVVIGDECVIGDRVRIYPNVVIHDGVQIGDDACIYANVTIRELCRLGMRAIIHSGTVIGADGFGFAPTAEGVYEKIPQRGIVVIEDDVEIGANCTIDRATIGETRIRRGAKLDNLIQVAHNVIIGEHTVIAAQTGISGSTKLGSHCQIGGQVGFVGHIRIADRTSIGAQSGVHKDVTTPGKTYFGYPFKELREAFRIEIATRKLPDLLVEMENLSKRISELEDRLRKILSENK